ncbi:MAG: TRAM domain-containing protein [Candidatus Eremiobacteraeota bacterium]|nr:TRAM domain-containing protein [Candidatus Eremiobacteraeota bacterium]MBV8433297.1 TRAM domain-containing protein [Candidatus Eremiobacteraeota bacterium]
MVFAVTGFLLGREAYFNLFSLHFANEALQLTFLILSPVVGAVVGALLAPVAQALFEGQLELVERAMERLSPAEIAGGAVGLIVGLVIAFLIKSIAFEFLAGGGKAGTYLAIVLYLIVAIFAAYLGARVGAKTRIVPVPRHVAGAGGSVPKLVDTSAIVDGRIVEIVESGFLDGNLIVPRFVLRELQSISDSVDPLKRTRGRRGFDVLSKLQEIASFEISERDYGDMAPGNVDARLVRLAQELGAKLITNDYNLNRVAHVEGIAVLNVNELANAVKPVVLPGEELRVGVVREGKEMHQGVGYLDDGTMIVVEQGRRLIGEEADVIVTSVLQTAAGRMIFARPKRDAGAAEARH